jgi:2-polyprenyl-3-methyl-5-hydroxy-6-metoxy-1,4-benzoquinol methylase
MSSCRICASPLTCTFADLGMSPLANSYIKPEQLKAMEPYYPLHVYVCHRCLLVQLEEFESPQHIFSDYAYFSSYSTAWLEHARQYTELMIQRFGFGPQSQVVEIASNDGYLLQYFRDKNVPILGIEPASNVASVAREKGIPTKDLFFGAETARQLKDEGYAADLLLGNNVLAHVPDLLSFVEGLQILLKPTGVITLEFPHVMQLIRQRQFDTIYHEHFSYLSLFVIEKVFERFDLAVFDVEELWTHGGSLRIYGKHREDASKPVTARVADLRTAEEQAGLQELNTYTRFSEQIKEAKCDVLDFLIHIRRAGKRVAGYGAPAKGNTLLNYCGIGPELISYTVDRSPHKQGTYLPGSRIPVYSPERISTDRPDYVLILPWNLRDEISTQMASIRTWGGRFVVPIPSVEVF